MYQNWEAMGDWPFRARDMTVVHHSFLLAARAEIGRRRRAAQPGAAKSFSMHSTSGSNLDRAFSVIGGRR